MRLRKSITVLISFCRITESNVRGQGNQRCRGDGLTVVGTKNQQVQVVVLVVILLAGAAVVLLIVFVVVAIIVV